jgi:lipoprotein-anchoring transpeptidase ErfK/SrfK
MSTHRHFPTVVLALSSIVLACLGVWRFSGSADPVTSAAAASPMVTDAAAAVPDTVPATALPATVAPTTPPPTTSVVPAEPATEVHPLPAGSGEGRRVVFSVAGQRMWWVGHDGSVLRTAPVSGRENTPATGTFQVYSRSERATGLDGSTMNHFVRFTHGPNGWAIGFHDIPIVDGAPAQTLEQLGTPLSHGCIRQSPEDARFTWDFLRVGDTVVVVA